MEFQGSACSGSSSSSRSALLTIILLIGRGRVETYSVWYLHHMWKCFWHYSVQYSSCWLGAIWMAIWYRVCGSHRGSSSSSSLSDWCTVASHRAATRRGWYSVVKFLHTQTCSHIVNYTVPIHVDCDQLPGLPATSIAGERNYYPLGVG